MALHYNAKLYNNFIISKMYIERLGQSRIQDFLKGGSNSTVAREIFEATPTLGQKHAHFDRF